MKITIKQEELAAPKTIYDLSIAILKSIDCILIVREGKELEVEKNTGDLNGLLTIISNFI